MIVYHQGDISISTARLQAGYVPTLDGWVQAPKQAAKYLAAQVLREKLKNGHINLNDLAEALLSLLEIKDL